ncbi:MAG: hypothetical protein AB2A00_08065 [Myxococcota bacterium]
MHTRSLWGAPGGIGLGHPADDVTRKDLLTAVERLGVELDALPVHLASLVQELHNAYGEVERMREAMGPDRMDADERRQELRRAAALAGVTLQREYAHLGTWFAPADPEAESFLPAQHMNPRATSLEKRVARLDALRQAYLDHPHLPDAETRAQRLKDASVRLFRAQMGAMGAGQEPVPLAEARQLFDRTYVTLRDSVRALRVLPNDKLVRVFPDLDPGWRQADLERTASQPDAVGP